MTTDGFRNHDALPTSRLLLVAAIAVLTILGTVGCSKKNKCTTSNDCPPGEVCYQGGCVTAEGENSTGLPDDLPRRDTNANTDTDGDGDGDPRQEVDADTSSDIGPTTDTGTDSETDSVCEATNLDGEACTDACECIGGYCDKGICCSGAECCNTAEDCENNLCTRASCDGNHVCNYSVGSLLCGIEDVEGSVHCTDGAACNGEAQCVPIATVDCGYFAASEAYTCDDVEASPVCYTSCTEADASETCLPGAVCIAGLCAPEGVGLANGVACVEGGACGSGHCNNGFCCPTGECCSETEDCNTSLCVTRTCSDNHLCVYRYDDHGCGVADEEDGDLCEGDSRCDGIGNCLPYTPCDVYAADPVAVPRYTCNDDMAMESCYSTCETSVHCADMFVCDTEYGLCVPPDRLDNGWSCLEHIACDSGYCANGYCCEGGTCCGDNDDCNGFACLESSQCVDACGEDNDQCDVGYHCDGEVCLADLPDGSGTCDEDSDCESGHCTLATGICCTEGSGDCCATDDQCDDGDPCSDDICTPSYSCINVPMLEGDSCDDGLYCNGEERCDADGECLLSASPCTSGDDPCIDIICDEEADECVRTPVNIGEFCSDVLYCLNGRRMVCTDDGACVDPNPDDGVPCTTFTEENPCIYHTCDEEYDSCVEHDISNGTPCDDEDPCTGDNQCQNGMCVRGETLPCDDGDPCTTDECTHFFGIASCGDHVPIADDQPCSEEYACFGESPVCVSGECIPSEPMCEDSTGICTIQECSEAYYDWVDCSESTPNAPFSLSCDDTVRIRDINIFTTREYNTYSDDCPGDFPGAEAAVVVDTTSAEVTITIDRVRPDGLDIGLMNLGNWCDPTTCLGGATNSLTFDAVSGENVIVLEALGTLPPTSLRIAVDCP